MLYDIRHQINKLYRSFIMIFIEYRSQKKKLGILQICNIPKFIKTKQEFIF